MTTLKKDGQFTEANVEQILALNKERLEQLYFIDIKSEKLQWNALLMNDGMNIPIAYEELYETLYDRKPSYARKPSPQSPSEDLHNHSYGTGLHFFKNEEDHEKDIEVNDIAQALPKDTSEGYRI